MGISTVDKFDKFQTFLSHCTSRVLDTPWKGSCLYIYLEYMIGGSMASVLQQFGAFEEKVIESLDLIAGVSEDGHEIHCVCSQLF